MCPKGGPAAQGQPATGVTSERQQQAISSVLCEKRENLELQLDNTDLIMAYKENGRHLRWSGLHQWLIFYHNW